MTHPGFPLQRSAFIIGDDLGAGVGDSITVTNVQPAGIFRSMVRPLPGLFFGWHYFSGAVIGSTSADWRPDGNRKGCAKSCFSDLFDSADGARNADVIVIVLGHNDQCAPEVTAENVVSICVELESRGKFVIVVPPIAVELKSQISSERERLMRARALIDEAMRRLWPNPDASDTLVRLGPDLEQTMKYQAGWSFGGRYPGAKGYRAWAHCYRDILFRTMKSAEKPYYARILGH